MRYVGGKSRIAKRIHPFLIRHGATRYIEPFVGGAAVLTLVARDFTEIMAADAMPDVIEMYRAMQDGWTPPSTITEDQYMELRRSQPSPLRTFAGFGASYGGKWWGGYARMRTTTRSGRPRVPEDFANQTHNSLVKARAAGAFDQHVRFEHASVFDLSVPTDLGGTVIYCDPPYASTTPYVGVEPFDTDRAWGLYSDWSARGAHVYVSEYSAPGGIEPISAFITPTSLRGGGSTGTAVENLYYLPSATVRGIAP